MRFLFVLLVVIALVAGYYTYQKDRREHEENYWMHRARDLIVKFTPTGATKNLQPDEGTYFRLVLLVKRAKDAGVDADKAISDACNDLNFGEGTEPARQSIMDSYERAVTLRVFDDPAGLMNLEHGETTTIAAPQWRGEKLAVVQLIPPWLAPEAAQSLPNLALVPVIVRDAWGHNISPDLFDRAHKFYSRHLITKESYERINSLKEPAVVR
jgi:hypothetical protein